MMAPDPRLVLAWCSGGDLMIYREGGPERVTTTRAAEMLGFYQRRHDSQIDLSQTARDYLRRWAEDLTNAIAAQREWTLCSGPLRSAA